MLLAKKKLKTLLKIKNSFKIFIPSYNTENRLNEKLLYIIIKIPEHMNK